MSAKTLLVLSNLLFVVLNLSIGFDKETFSVELASAITACFCSIAIGSLLSTDGE